MTAIREHDRVVLTTNRPAERLTKGDVGTVVHIYSNLSAYEIEFVALDGKPIAIATLEPSQVRAVQHSELSNAGRVA
ncbi:MAG: DUF4926 domain-containing protein [Gammaproteobacteria bacterium]